MALPLDNGLKIGIQTIHRQPDTLDGPWMPKIDEMARFIEAVDQAGFDSVWVGDHLSMPLPFFDPFLMIAQAAVVSRRLTFGTGVYLLPLRSPGPAAKQAATLDHLTEGRFIFGVGIGGEFPKEYEVAGVPIGERGARLSEGIQAMRALWSGMPASFSGKHYRFENVLMTPPPRQPGGPPIWGGGRSDPALRRIGRLADGYLSYVVTPTMYAEAMGKISAAADQAGRKVISFGTGHLLFARVDDDYDSALDIATESLSKRYAMDFRRAAERYAALGSPDQVAEKVADFYNAGVRHVSVDLVGPYEKRMQQIEWFAGEVIPRLRHLITTEG
jgi:probable F420-dependent oxidoreductase